jgi:hypothetical protein
VKNVGKLNVCIKYCHLSLCLEIEKSGVFFVRIKSRLLTFFP